MLLNLFLVISLVICPHTVLASIRENILAPKPLHDLSPQCLNDTEIWFQSLQNFANVSLDCITQRKCTTEELRILEDNLYAIEQLDAFGQIPVPGMLEITTLYDGSYQECQRISGVKYETNYCYLVIKPGKNVSCAAGNSSSPIDSLPLRLAVCLPYSCDHQDMINIFNQASLYPFTACAAYCVKFDVEKDAPFWGFSSFFLVMVFIAVAATVFDYFRDSLFGYKNDKEKNILFKILLAFSFWTNAELILSVKEQKPGFIKSLDCIRLFSMTWVVTGHSYLYIILSNTLSPIINFPKHFWNHLILNAFLSVDTFFVLSGIVVAYLFFKTKPSRKIITNPVTWVMFYVHRYLRLTPPVMLFIGFFTVYAPYLQGTFSASAFNDLVAESNACKESWWQNLLYINNFGDTSNNNNNTCYGPTWYLAADTQLYIASPIFLIALYFSFAAGTALLVSGCIGSIIATYVLFNVYDMASDSYGNGDATHFFGVIYSKPWIRCPPYLVGIFTGYLLAHYGNRKIRLNWALALGGWAVAFAIAGFCIFGNYDYDKGSHWSVFARASFYNFHRLGWAVFLSWVISANHMGWGGPINNFMSHPIWQPFGRLSYCAYIVHWMVLFYYHNISGTLHFYSTWEVFTHVTLPATFMAYVFAFFWSCLFEISTLKSALPLVLFYFMLRISRLEKMLFEVIFKSDRPSQKLGGSVENGKLPNAVAETWSSVETTPKTN
ncbi:Protein CBG07345 [Caenorhabditis briggsae]|uniref:Protein CBG07345 n=1 Tax=Caenorhabditis briggsae TaxID=6238 RepID=A8X4Z1_CAEBR|nr:Protein CBG07345 [Caenorhabditis briggsae]CAP27701.2 Protein CBG07345 [Caenorhabditis briggsae]